MQIVELIMILMWVQSYGKKFKMAFENVTNTLLFVSFARKKSLVQGFLSQDEALCHIFLSVI
ncbi:MAG: hypothetical protein ACOCOY_04435, partial [Prevotella sp.]